KTVERESGKDKGRWACHLYEPGVSVYFRFLEEAPCRETKLEVAALLLFAAFFSLNLLLKTMKMSDWRKCPSERTRTTQDPVGSSTPATPCAIHL
ncbi:hypothetical protein LEMLEM_LOCUS4405, partial [Lemmus lemmus]